MKKLYACPNCGYEHSGLAGRTEVETMAKALRLFSTAMSAVIGLLVTMGLLVTKVSRTITRMTTFRVAILIYQK